MGSWVTLHLFDENSFYSKVIPTLKVNNHSLRETVIEYLKLFRIGGIVNLSEARLQNIVAEKAQSIVDIANDFDPSFKRNLKLEEIKEVDHRIDFINNDNNYYDFCRFFEFLVFRTCVDFFPHIPLGKAGLYRIHTTKIDSLINSIISTHQSSAYLYSYDSMGIECWIPKEDTKLLYYSIEELKLNEDDKIAEGIIEFLQIAYKRELGLVIGRDLRESQLEKLPQFKIISKSEWDNIDTRGRLLFKR